MEFLCVILSIVVLSLWSSLRKAERREARWREEAYKVLEALKKANRE